MKVKVFIGLLIAAVCLYLAFRGISVADVLRSLSTARPGWIFAGLLLYVVGYSLRSVRWSVLMEPIKPISWIPLFPVMIIGFFANNLLPLRMGELVRAHITGRKFKISRTASLGTILLERICDTLGFLTTLILPALMFPFPSAAKKGAAVLGGACLLVIIALIIIVRHQERFARVIRLSKIPESWKAQAIDVIQNFAQGVSGMNRFQHTLAALLLSLVIWTIEGSFLYLIARSFALPLSYPQSFFLLFFMGLSVTLPQAPGYVGTMELFGVTALRLLGIPKEQGLPVILAVHGLQFVFIGVLGLWALGKEGLSLRSLAESR